MHLLPLVGFIPKLSCDLHEVMEKEQTMWISSPSSEAGITGGGRAAQIWNTRASWQPGCCQEKEVVLGVVRRS